MTKNQDWRLVEMDADSAIEEIAIRSKLLQPCECGCGELLYYDSFDVNEKKAYTLANYLVSKKFPIVKDFAKGRDLTDAIKNAIPEFDTKCRNESYLDWVTAKED